MWPVFVGVSTSPLIECPGVREYVSKSPGTGQILSFQAFLFEGWKISPIAVSIPKSGDVGIGAHAGAGEEQDTTGLGEDSGGLAYLLNTPHSIP
jgi:hypothetical protein